MTNDLAALKSEALRNVKQAYRASDGFGGVYPQIIRTNSRVLYALYWQHTVSRSKERLIAVEKSADLDAIASAVWDWLQVARHRQGVIEFPAPLGKSA